MTELYQPVARLVADVRSRWRRLVLFRAVARAASGAAAGLALVLALAYWAGPKPMVVAGLAVLGILLLVAAAVWALRSFGQRPPDARIARFIEERQPELDERLVSAVSLAQKDEAAERPVFADSMIRDAARAASAIDPGLIVPGPALRRAGFQAAAAVLMLAAVALLGRHVAERSFDALTLSLFPSHIRIEVTPGDARVQAGLPFVVQARLVGNDAPVKAQLLRAEGEDGSEWRAVEMTSAGDGRFTLSLNALSTSFRYRIVAAGAESGTFSVSVVRPPRVQQIDVEYSYPAALRLEPRVEKDGGDIYAPQGTSVRVLVHTDRPTASGQLLLGNDQALALSPDSAGQVLTGSLTIAQDDAYRVALADAGGMSSRGDTEYFIRMLDDRPPEVHVTRPASDRRVTALEEVDIEAEAGDDFGVASLDLVYAVRGGAEKVVPMRIPARMTSVTGRHTLFLEDLDVRPGDFVSYYVRARDLARGKRSSEARSDIFFLEIKPFEEEFTLAQSQAAMGGGASNPQIDDLVAAQKEIIVATWKLDRRAQAASGAKSAPDIRAVGAAEGELKTRVEQAGSAFGSSRLRTPRRPAPPGRGAAPAPSGPRAGQTLAEEDAMTAAAKAMGAAVTLLNGLKMSDAVAPEMEALNHLLRAQADVKKREVQRQQAGGGGGGNRGSQDLSSLFDKELARHQQTNYETPQHSSQENAEKTSSALDKIKELAERQDELTKRQQELARNETRLSEEERKRALDKLTRDQDELRQRAEELAQQMARQQSGQQPGENTPPSGSQSGQQAQPGQQNPSGQSQGQQSGSGQQAQGGRSGQQPSSGQQASRSGSAQGQSEQRLREISEEMRNAAGDLGRNDASQASARAASALEKLRDLERQMQASTPDGQRRAMGDTQLEARQLADAQRRIAAETARAAQGETGAEALRRLAGEEDRLAERMRRMQEALTQQAQGGAGAPGAQSADGRQLQQAASDAAGEIERQRLAERMSQSADALRSALGSPDGKTPGSPSAGAQEEIARAIDRLANRLAPGSPAGDDESKKLSGNLARVQALRERLDDITRQLDQMNRQSANQAGQTPGAPGGRSGGQPSSPGAPQDGRSGARGDGQTPSAQPGRSQRQPGSASSQQSASGAGQPGQGQGESRGGGTDLAQLQAEATQALKALRDLTEQAGHDDNSLARGGAGRTFEGRGMTLSAPGTEGFKQDFAKWQELTRQATAVLDQVESSVSRKLQEKEAHERLAAGVDDRAPAAYQSQVDSYFRALATRKKP